MQIAVALFVPFAIYRLITFTHIDIDSLLAGIEVFIVIVICILYFFEQVTGENQEILMNAEPLFAKPDFWMMAGIIVYMSGTFFFLILSTSMTEQQQHSYWILQYSFNTLKNVFFCISIIIAARKSTKTLT